MGPFGASHLAGNLIDLCRADDPDGRGYAVLGVFVSRPFSSPDIFCFCHRAFQRGPENVVEFHGQRPHPLVLCGPLLSSPQSGELQRDHHRRARIVALPSYPDSGRGLWLNLHQRATGGYYSYFQPAKSEMKRDYLLILTIVVGLSAAALTTHWNDAHHRDLEAQFSEEPLYLNGPAMKRLTLAFNGVAADWYWMRSLQYVGRKIVNYEDTHSGNFSLSNLSSLDLRLLPSLLRMTTTLDPQFLEPYYYGAFILPDIDPNEAIALLNR